jgi:ATP-dependent helicase HepA
VQDVLGAEQDRLKALAQVNPNIRQEEIDYLAQTRSDLEQYLESATMKLDAVRVIIAT